MANLRRVAAARGRVAHATFSRVAPVDSGGADDRRDTSSRLLTYTSSPLDAPVEITGQPRVDIFLSANEADGGLFVYLEDVAPDGRVRYVTEGQVRLVHRGQPRTFRRVDAQPMRPDVVEAVSVDLLPTSYRFPAGNSIRLAIAGADAGTLELPQPPGTALVYTVHRDAQHPTRVSFPTYARNP